MYNAARRDGISLYIVSATRNFTQQKSIWDARFLGKRKIEGINIAKKFTSHIKRAKHILRYSSMPGYQQASLGYRY